MALRVGLSCPECGNPLRPQAAGWSCPNRECAPLRAENRLRMRGPHVKALELDPWQLFN
ncbi:MAG TPA: hypothetical protein VNZ52_15415 [Candidatus Thermoplasmatota archaeon]|nr:hypothetical protein [Candidatus Thermoplasmatota archaeon]